MNYLYIIGGSTRSGKTTILNKVMTAKPMIAVQTDAIREGMRKALIGESSVTISKLSFSGDATFQRLRDDKDIDITKHFSQEISQDELIWNAVVGLVNYYDDKGVDLIIEGMEITPERVKSLVLKTLKIKAAFVGITKDSSNGDNAVIKQRFNEEIEKSKKVASAANGYGYKFFSLNNDDFEGHCNNVVNYLLE